MRVDLLTKEYPPTVYGGAGVHVTELARALRQQRDLDVRVQAFGPPRDEPGTTGFAELPELADANPALQTMGVDLLLAQAASGSDLVHSHSWYANFAGHLAGIYNDIPHVITAHSLEPLRPWKAEQLGGGYRVSSWIESTAYHSAAAIIAVSHGMRADVLRCYPDVNPDLVHVVHNGIDTDQWQRRTERDIAAQYGVDDERRTVMFVGRITRQKGLPYLLQAAAQLDDDVQLVLCAGAPDTPEILAEVEALVAALRTQREHVVWIQDMLSIEHVQQLLSLATVFACPSVYEPLGIVNLEAMACEVAVVATATGGIPEVVVDNETGWLVPIAQVDDGSGTPIDPSRFVDDFAAALNEALSDPARARQFGQAGRVRAIAQFSWNAIGEQTSAVYQAALER